MLNKKNRIQINKRTFPRYKFYRRYLTDLHNRLRFARKLQVRTTAYLIDSFFSKLARKRRARFQPITNRKKFRLLFQKFSTWKNHFRRFVYRVDSNNKAGVKDRNSWKQTLFKLKTFFSKFFRQSRTKLSKSLKTKRNFNSRFSFRENRVISLNKKNHLIYQAKFFPFLLGLFNSPDTHKYLYDKKSFILRRGIMDSSLEIPTFTFLFIRGPLQRFFMSKLIKIATQQKRLLIRAYIKRSFRSNNNVPKNLLKFSRVRLKRDRRRFTSKFARFCFPEAMTFFPAAFCFYYRGHTPFFKEPLINTGLFENLSRVPYALSTIVFN